MAIPWTNDDAFEFARIIPEGLEAERALDMVYDAPTLADHHRSCIQVRRRTRLLDSETDMNNSDDTDTSPAEYWAGHYLLSLRNAPKNPFSIGWRIGRGSSKHPEDDTRGVDLLLIRPRCKSQGVAAVHARIQFNRVSGVLMLMGVQDDKPISYTAHDSATPIFLASGQGHVLYQNTNLFSLGSLRYRLVFKTFTDTEYASFVGERNNLLAGSGLPPPHPGLSAVPRPQDVKRSFTVTHGSLAAGKFGWVSAAVEVQSGKPLVVKEQRATNQHGLRSILHEIQIGGAFKAWPA
ncbi:MAG: hypothetical protein LQ343_007348 [Gyalolechia ehrenbergii]|nr:MAG: hypothetical protein LQ343_007348 [Gyalolechia ehrenbergii]